MIYQVMLETSQGWALFRLPTHDAQAAQELARQAAATCPGMHACIVSAVTEAELEESCLLWQRTHPRRASADIAGILPGSATSTTTEHWHGRMNALELGPGGDRDAPYIYHPPPDWHVAAEWLHLQARVTRGEVGGACDGARHCDPDAGGLPSAA